MPETSEKNCWPDPRARVAWLDLAKAVSAFAVVMTHVASIGWQALEPIDAAWLPTSVYEIATRFAVPVFFMVTGALILNPRRSVGMRRLWGSDIARTAAIALLVSAAFSALERLLFGWTGWRSLISETLDGPYFIWYLWVLAGIYALTPALRVVARDRCLLGYTLVLLAVFVLGQSTAQAMAPGSWVATWLGNFILFSTGAEGVFYCLLGAWLVSWRPSRRASVVLMAAGALALVVAVALNYASARTVGPDLYYVSRSNLLIALFSVGAFEGFRLVGPCLGDGRRLRDLAAVGLAVYLIHPFLRLVMEGVPLFAPVVRVLLEAPVVAVPLVSLVLWALSLGLACARGACASLFRRVR